MRVLYAAVSRTMGALCGGIRALRGPLLARSHPAWGTIITGRSTRQRAEIQTRLHSGVPQGFCLGPVMFLI